MSAPTESREFISKMECGEQEFREGEVHVFRRKGRLLMAHMQEMSLNRDNKSDEAEMGETI
jgi:hypothetical protein